MRSNADDIRDGVGKAYKRKNYIRSHMVDRHMIDFVVLSAEDDEINAAVVKALNTRDAAKKFRVLIGYTGEGLEVFVARKLHISKIQLMPPEDPEWRAIHVKL